MTKMILKYAFKNLKICNYIPLSILKIPISQQVYAKNISKHAVIPSATNIPKKSVKILIQNKL